MALELTSMSVLDADALASNLRAMFDADVVYARSGPLLVSLNPYRPLPLYDEQTLARYRSSPNPASLAPHIYGVAAEAHAQLVETGRSQTLIISGESGAGKTVNSKHVMAFFAAGASAAPPAPAGVSLHERLLRSNPLLEAFGCARTEHNAHSSRYGKFVQLGFDKTGRLSGGRLTTYLLEKSRVVSHGAAERSYAVLYALCAGASDAERTALALGPSATAAAAFACLRPAGAPPAAPADAPPPPSPAQSLDEDARMLEAVREALDALGVARAKQRDVLALLGAVLHLGNVEFARAPSADAAGGADDDVAQLASDGARAALGAASELLGLESAQLSAALLAQRMRAGSEWLVRAHSVGEARALRAGLAKAVYAAVFEWLVAAISASLGAEAVGTAPALRVDSPTVAAAGLSATGSACALPAAGGGGLGGGGGSFIGIVDIFGFERFQTNSLEQLCINYANEKLQRLFVRCVLVEAQQQLVDEGVLNVAQLVESEAASAGERALALLEGRPAGLLPLLAEECILRNGSDASLLQKLAREHAQHPSLLLRPKRLGDGFFTVAHYAEPVEYAIEGFLAKNKDPLSQNVAVLLQRSRAPFVCALFATDDDDDGARDAASPARGSGGGGGGSPSVRGSGHATARVMRSNSFKRVTRRPGVAGGGGGGGGDAAGAAGAAGGRGGRGGVGGGSRFSAVADQFSHSLDSLLRTVGRSDVRFVRCIRPNGLQAPGRFEAGLVLRQLRSSGLIHAVTLARASFPELMTVEAFVGRFRLLAQRPRAAEGPAPAAADARAFACWLLARAGVEPSLWAAGTRRLFFKAGVLAQLNSLRAERLALAALVLQRGARHGAARRAEARRRDAAAAAAAEAAAAVAVAAAAAAAAAEAAAAEAAAAASAAAEAQALAAQTRHLRAAQRAAEARAAAAQAAGALPPPPPPLARASHAPPSGRAPAAAAAAAAVALGDVTISFSDVMAGYTPLYPQPPPWPAGGARAHSDAPCGDALVSSALLRLLGLRAPAEELLGYGAYLGLELSTDWQLLWIADEALSTPAPPGWEEHQDPTGGAYFQNVVTAEISLQHPCDFHFQQLLYRERAALLAQAGPVELVARPAAAELAALSSWRGVMAFDFAAEDAGELTAARGQPLTVLDGEIAPEGWAMAAFNGAVGLVPAAFVLPARTQYADADRRPIAPVHGGLERDSLEWPVAVAAAGGPSEPHSPARTPPRVPPSPRTPARTPPSPARAPAPRPPTPLNAGAAVAVAVTSPSPAAPAAPATASSSAAPATRKPGGCCVVS